MNRIAIIGIAVVASLVVAAFAFLSLPALQRPLLLAAMERAIGVDRDALYADDALRVIVCGAGSPFPDRERAEPCFAVIAGGRMILIDIGSRSWSSLARMPVRAERLEAVFLTHYHSDHIADLPIANMQSWAEGRAQPLRVHGGPGIERVVGGFNEAYAPDNSYRSGHHGPSFMRPENGRMVPALIANPDGSPLTGDQTAVAYDDGALRITAFAVEHPPVVPAYGFRVDYKGRSVVFSGDTHLTPSVGLNARGADVLIHEAVDKELIQALGSAASRAGRDRVAQIMTDIQTYHATPAEAAAVAREAGVKLLVLNHMVPPIPSWMGDAFVLRDIPADAPEVKVAFDGLLITLPLGSDAVETRRIAN